MLDWMITNVFRISSFADNSAYSEVLLARVNPGIHLSRDVLIVQ